MKMRKHKTAAQQAAEAEAQAAEAQAAEAQAAEDATGEAQDATGEAQDATGEAQDATGEAQDATGEAQDATGEAQDATGEAQDATGEAQDATARAQHAEAIKSLKTMKPGERMPGILAEIKASERPRPAASPPAPAPSAPIPDGATCLVPTDSGEKTKSGGVKWIFRDPETGEVISAGNGRITQSVRLWKVNGNWVRGTENGPKGSGPAAIRPPSAPAPASAPTSAPSAPASAPTSEPERWFDPILDKQRSAMVKIINQCDDPMEAADYLKASAELYLNAESGIRASFAVPNWDDYKTRYYSN